ncbi:hypothetical protein C0Q70_05980 [Pomacea canaliculata]|uniref:Nucleoporin p58/p45 n=1 Tax=Pomacea canaliculata TaxID=400727 RepID=A0A2T7PMR0_POMCA|nr:hypothetical protein C0Q70_05980 [Pomacea canaliculata]
MERVEKTSYEILVVKAFGLQTQTAASTSNSGLSFSFTPKTAENTTVSTLNVPVKTTTANTGFSFGSGLSFGGAPATQSGTSSGLSFGFTPATSGITSAGLTLGTSTTTTGGFGGFNLGGIPLASTAISTSAGSIFNTVTTSASVTGLGGADPAISASNSGISGGGLGSDGKALKETLIPDQLVLTVDDLQKYVKEEKAEDIAALRQLLSVVSNGLQRNACTLEKLKAEMTKELKNAEMAQRTKDIPPGLQYENTAPNEYFEQLVEQFEGRMVSYRQQIEMLENHLAVLHQPARNSPAEIFTLIKRLHESFVALAAQLQQVHEAIKGQKEQFITYRRVFHGDTKDIFQSTKPVSRPSQRRLVDTSGPTPFPGVANPAAAAMASILTKQQPHGPPVAGLLRTGSSSAWPSTGGIGLSSGLSHLGSSSSSTTILGQPVAQASAGFSYSSGIGAAGSSNSSTLTSTLNSLNNTASTTLNMSAATKQPFMLQKPPQGAKRGKR